MTLVGHSSNRCFKGLNKSASKVRTKVRTGTPHNAAVTCLCLKAKDEVNSTANGPGLTAGAVDPRVCSAWALYTHTIVFFLGMQRSRRTQKAGSALRGGCTSKQSGETEGTSREVSCAVFRCCCAVGQKCLKNVMGNGHFLYSVLIMATFTILK